MLSVKYPPSYPEIDKVVSPFTWRLHAHAFKLLNSFNFGALDAQPQNLKFFLISCIKHSTLSHNLPGFHATSMQWAHLPYTMRIRKG